MTRKETGMTGKETGMTGKETGMTGERDSADQGFHQRAGKDDEGPDKEHVPDRVVQGEGEGAAEQGDQCNNKHFDTHGTLCPNLVYHHSDAVEAAPDHEIPAGAVPQAAKQHGVHAVDVGGD